MAAYVAAKPGNQGPALYGEGLVKRGEWSTLSKTVNGRELLFGCDRRHTLSDDGKCWSYCGAAWVGIKSIKTWLTVNSQKPTILYFTIPIGVYQMSKLNYRVFRFGQIYRLPLRVTQFSLHC